MQELQALDTTVVGFLESNTSVSQAVGLVRQEEAFLYRSGRLTLFCHPFAYAELGVSPLAQADTHYSDKKGSWLPMYR